MNFTAIVTIACVLLMTGVPTPTGRSYLAMGASETAGLMVPRKATYPEIVAHQCDLTLTVMAKWSHPSLLLKQRAMRNADVATIFIDINNATLALHVAKARVNLMFQALSHVHRGVVILFDPVGIPGFRFLPKQVLTRQLSLNRYIENFPRPRTVKIVFIEPPSPTASYLQADGVHPNARGHNLIARRVVSALGQFCQH